MNRLKIIFPQDITNLEDVKSFHPKIKKVLTGAHISPKLTSSRICYLEFENKSDVESAFKVLKTKKINGGRLVVHRVKTPTSKSTKKKAGTFTRCKNRGSVPLIKLYITNPPENVKKKDIREAFPKCNNIKISAKGRYVSFTTPTAKTALLWQIKEHSVCGQPVQVTCKTPGKHKHTRRVGPSPMDQDEDTSRLQDMDADGNLFEETEQSNTESKYRMRKRLAGESQQALHSVKIPKKCSNRRKAAITASKKEKFLNIELVIENPPNNITKEDIEAAFPQCKSVTISPTDRTVSFTIRSAKTALVWQLKQHTICGQPVTVVSKLPGKHGPKRRPGPSRMDTSESEQDEDMELI